MRTAIIIVCGIALWGLCIGAARLFAGSASAATLATVAFIVLWFLIALANLVVGVTKAGYSFGEELPIFLLIFALPVAVALLVKWRRLGASQG